MFTVYVEPLEQPADSVYSRLRHRPCACCMSLAARHVSAWLVVQAGPAGPGGSVLLYLNKEFSALLGQKFSRYKTIGLLK